MREVRRAPLEPGEPATFSMLRVPFFLEPRYPHSEGFEETNRVRLHRKWGSEEGFLAQKQRHRLKERGWAVGIAKFDLDRIASSTFAAHRLVQHVTKTAGVDAAERLYADLNYRHFEKGRKLNDRAMLVECAARVGIDETDARLFLESDQGTAEIERAQRLLEQLGVHSIPTLCVGGRHLVSAAVPHQVTVQHLRQLEAMEPRERGTGWMFAEPLGIPQHVLDAPLDLGSGVAGDAQEAVGSSG
uniref:DSBA-like thioredoxin domain-containing protein n=1 Tax=Calcidiscus leptoporus TaxID=127549 RepID=A0A7S0J7L2_9EUKA|mmetsp:Transcript_43087/g.100973  ORF Transcript_43087/g.100973 Transcript_43087/m.100973 type:complete len:244 (+) Transcript_43087:155-886(+)